MLNPKHSGARSQWLVIGPFVVAVALLAGLGLASAHVLSAVRAYAGGESLWSKSRKDAVHHLTRYAQTGAPTEHARFLAAVAVPLGDRIARTELDRPEPDLAAARRGLLQGGNHADDVDAMLLLYRSARRVPVMADAIAVWAEADLEIERLQGLAEQLHHGVQAGGSAADDVRSLAQQLAPLDDRLTALEQRFSASMGELSRGARRLVELATLALAVGLVGAAVALSVGLRRRQGRAEQALRDSEQRDVGVREQAAQALQASEERLQRALDASSLCLWDYRIENGGIYLSESWSQWLGGPAEVTLTTFAELASQVPVEERDDLLATLVGAVKNPQGTYRVEHRVRKRDGGWLWVLSIGRVVERDAQGRALRMVGTNLDITERKRADATRLALETQLRESQKMEAIGTLAAGIAHDFNNILGAIIGNLALARDEVGAGHSALLSLEQIGTSARRARTLVQQILAFGRRQPHEPSNRALAPMLQETLALMRSILPAGIALETRLTTGPLRVMANTTHVQQVLMNLCTNAWHALRGASGRLEVGLEALDLPAGEPRPAGLPPGAYAHVWVRDSGCGMDAETRARIFEPFFTTKPIGQGTGLGLSVVHGIVTAHRGAITVESAPGCGSTFHVYLPQVAAHEPVSAPSGWGDLAGSMNPDDATFGAGRHVLCIDDDAVMLLLVERLLLRLGYRITGHDDPRRAIEAIRAEPLAYDLVVSDYNMPDLSGLDTARAIALVRPGLPVLISSGHLTDEQRAELQDCGVREVISKENTLEELGPAVARLLHARRAAAPRTLADQAQATAMAD